MKSSVIAALFALALAGCSADASPGPDADETSTPSHAPAQVNDDEPRGVDALNVTPVVATGRPAPSCNGCGPGPQPWREANAPGER